VGSERTSTSLATRSDGLALGPSALGARRTQTATVARAIEPMSQAIRERMRGGPTQATDLAQPA